MSSILILLSAVIADPNVESAERDQPRRYFDISSEMSDLLRLEAQADDMSERGRAIRGLTKLYREIATDPRLETSGVLKKYKAKLWSRLTSVKKDLERQIAREKKRQPRSEREKLTAAMDEADRSLAEQLAMTSVSLGGPSMVFAQGAAGGGMVSDHGESLVELIESTITPDFWDTNGGPGVIRYYRPLQRPGEIDPLLHAKLEHGDKASDQREQAEDTEN